MDKGLLIVEDDERMRKLLSFYFRDEGYRIVEAENGEEAIARFASEKIDLIILDVMMPEVDGWEVCREVRRISAVPIMFLTARADDEDEYAGFQLGADDYVTKPFTPRILVARARALLRRAQAAEDMEKRLEFGRLVILPAAGEVTIGDQPVPLSRREYDLLLYLANNAGLALSREQILDQVWGYDYEGELRTVDTHVWRLREKLGNSGCWISTVRGRGYKFEPDGERVGSR
ncbi:MAG: response regulator transcription factor [Solirubrobacterales bacterium]